MNRQTAWTLVDHCVDDTLGLRQFSEIPDPNDKVRLIGWQSGGRASFVAVWSYLDVTLTDDEAINLATDLMCEYLRIKRLRKPDYIF